MTAIGPTPMVMPACQHPSKHRATRGHFNSSNSPSVQHDKPVTMSAMKDAGVLRKCRADVLNDFVDVVRIGFLVRDIHVVASGQSDAQHDLCHGDTIRGERCVVLKLIGSRLAWIARLGPGLAWRNPTCWWTRRL